MNDHNPEDFPNIIFDYGGVIINIDVDRTVNAFKKLIPNNIQDIQKQIESSDVFKTLERGGLEEHMFLEQINGLLESYIQWPEFELAWNAMIGDIPLSRLQVLERVSKSHRIFLLSNTNSIHLRKVNEVVKKTIGADSVDHYFEKVYYSNQIGMRKPDAEIYEHVLKDMDLDPKQTIFLDDNIHNLKGASDSGIATCHITEDRSITKIF